MRIIYTIFVFAILFSSCSTPRRSITHKKRKARTQRTVKKAKPQYATLRDAVILEARKYLGTPYKYGGKKPSQGLDCSGLVSYVYGKQGLQATGASHHLAKQGIAKSRSRLEPGDLVFFGKNGKISHVSVVHSRKGGSLYVIHSTSSSGVKIDEINASPYWNELYLFGRDLISEQREIVSGR